MEFQLSLPQRKALLDYLEQRAVAPSKAGMSRIWEWPEVRLRLSGTGKCQIEGPGSSAWVADIFEPVVLGLQPGSETALDAPCIGLADCGGEANQSLTVAAVYLCPESAAWLEEGLDAHRLRARLVDCYSLLQISPERLQQLTGHRRDDKRIRTWARATALQNLLDRCPPCFRAVAADFGDRQQVEKSLGRFGRELMLEVLPPDSRHPSMQAAEILAQAAFETRVSSS